MILTRMSTCYWNVSLEARRFRFKPPFWFGKLTFQSLQRVALLHSLWAWSKADLTVLRTQMTSDGTFVARSQNVSFTLQLTKRVFDFLQGKVAFALCFLLEDNPESREDESSSSFTEPQIKTRKVVNDFPLLTAPVSQVYPTLSSNCNMEKLTVPSSSLFSEGIWLLCVYMDMLRPDHIVLQADPNNSILCNQYPTEMVGDAVNWIRLHPATLMGWNNYLEEHEGEPQLKTALLLF